MKITMLGTGYVGLTFGTCLSDLGNEVICADIDEEKITNLKKQIIPIYEPGLAELVKRNIDEGRLSFTTDLQLAIKTSEIIYIAVGTPVSGDGSANLQYVFSCAETIGKNLNGYKVIVVKSTVPVGTCNKIKEIIQNNTEQAFDIISNPEFLREGAAIKDFFNPDRTIIGYESEKSKKIMHKIYKAVERTDKPILYTDIKSAEMIKYASNAFLATKISFINEIANLCEKVGGNVKTVAKGMGLDDRIGPRFLQAGLGYGGSCFPKDVLALVALGRHNNYNMEILQSVHNVNQKQRFTVFPKLETFLPNVKDKTIAVWGLSFKPKTDDLREAPSISIIQDLIHLGAKIRAFDPVASSRARNIFPEIFYSKNPYEAVEGADALIIATEWNEFRELDKKKIKELMVQPNIIDGRNIYDPDEMSEHGFNYISIGRESIRKGENN
ncbi:UDP-glucose/GDP-mannose dehydrogenase family protein [Candidatus Woesearchaeota archaeon]|nr:UDP-glucose/GDP-mannose dehydrogenase family protein [Candidatus Woesearchaeota archaeon]